MAVSTTSSAPQTQGGRFLKGGFRDPECFRAQHRHSLALTLLSAAGVTPTYPEHAETCIRHPSKRFNRLPGNSYHCDPGCGWTDRPTWPEWCTGEMFDRAYRLADEIQTERGAWHQREASAAKMEADRARWAAQDDPRGEADR
jgi:hypothetical protein